MLSFNHKILADFQGEDPPEDPPPPPDPPPDPDHTI